MKRPLIFVQDPNALKNWLIACGSDAKVLYDLEAIDTRFTPSDCILLIQISKQSGIKEVSQLATAGFDILLFSDEPSNTEGLQVFKAGIKGYLNTFATPERIEQALATIASGSIWLGVNVMQAMIDSVIQKSIPSDAWKVRLTNREQQVAMLVLETQSNKEIAKSLDITERTVKSHMHNIFEKLNVSDRLAMALKIKNWT
ncbi:MAG: response regulator transcription factor [Gammaproteobacteria bacterium]|nr:response regulator transcription factor [Gammaproteobacteria bacterium]